MKSSTYARRSVGWVRTWAEWNQASAINPRIHTASGSPAGIPQSPDCAAVASVPTCKNFCPL
eukprot:6490488-Amphidinium_carterae.1